MNQEGYERLANAVILSAVKDYRKALRRLKRRPDSRGAMDDALREERFFHSDMFSALTEVDPDYLIRKLQGEARAL